MFNSVTGAMVDTAAEPALPRVQCPSRGCRADAWRMPNGDVWCSAIEAIVPAEQPPLQAGPGRPPLCPDCKETCLVEGQLPCTEEGCGCACRQSVGGEQR